MTTPPSTRPILKRQPEIESCQEPSNPFPFAESSTVLFSPHVHFPPTPTLTSIETTHSSLSYNREPIDIAPNPCALPERGCRVLTANTESAREMKAKVIHGQYFPFCPPRDLEPEPEPLPPAAMDVPALVHDSYLSSSESDDFDDLIYHDPKHIPPISLHFSRHALRNPIPRTHSQEQIDNALSFLPYPPSPEKSKRRRSASRPRAVDSRSALRTAPSAFATSPVDGGCLGGF